MYNYIQYAHMYTKNMHKVDKSRSESAGLPPPDPDDTPQNQLMPHPSDKIV